MKLIAFQYGTTQITQRMALPEGDPEKTIPIGLLFFLVETENRRILVDVGCDTMPGFPLFTFQKPVDVLLSYGLRPCDITDVVLTHAHHDHADACRYYTNATFFVQEEAYPRAQRYLPQNAAVQTFCQDVTIAPRITVKKIGGHAAGSSIVLLDTPAETIVLCGDECYIRDNLRLCIPTGSSRCPEASAAFVQQYSQPGFRTVLFHEPILDGRLGSQVLYQDP